MSVVWSGAWVAHNAGAALLALLVLAVLIAAHHRLLRASRPVAAVGATLSAAMAPLPERLRTLAPVADDLIDPLAVPRRSPLASSPGKYPRLPVVLRPANGRFPGTDAPDPQTLRTDATTTTPASNVRLP